MAVLAAALAASSGLAHAQPFVVFDGEFLESDWSTQATLNNGTTESSERRVTGGNPDAYLYMRHDLPPFSNMSVVHTYEAFVYDPATRGALAGLSVSFDQIEFDPPFPNAGVGSLFALWQDGSLWIAKPDLTYTHTTWETASVSCLQPEDFYPKNDELPDFTETASPMRFAFIRGNSNTGDQVSFPIQHGVDNFRVVVFPAPNPDCSGEPADVRIEKSDADHLWGDDSVIPYSIDVSNAGDTPGSVTIVETIPDRTSFSAAGSTPGWQCGTGPGATCSFDVADLAGGEQRTLAFNVRVTDGTDPLWDVFNEAQIEVAATPALQNAAKHGSISMAAISTQVPASEVTPPRRCTEPLSCCFTCWIYPSYCGSSQSFQSTGNVALGGIDGRSTNGDPILLYRLRDRVFDETRGGQRATDLYYEHSGAMVTAAIADPGIATAGVTNLLEWQSHLHALVSGAGVTALVTQEQIDGLQTFLDVLRASAQGSLLLAIDRERARLDLDDWVGIDMEEALRRLDRLSCEGYELELFCGELTGDCNITASDALAALHIAVGTRRADSAGDMDGSGAVTAADALRVLRIAVSLDPPTDTCNLAT